MRVAIEPPFAPQFNNEPWASDLVSTHPKRALIIFLFISFFNELFYFPRSVRRSKLERRLEPGAAGMRRHHPALRNGSGG
jgi:hypothetical protein